MTARILIADDHELLREGLKSMVAKSGEDWSVCGEAADGQQTIQLARELNPDLIILDITMPGMSGFETMESIRSLRIDCPILVFTMHESELLASNVRKAAGQGLVLKSQAGKSLVAAVRALLSGGTFFSPSPEASPKETKSTPGPLFCRGFAFAFAM